MAVIDKPTHAQQRHYNFETHMRLATGMLLPVRALRWRPVANSHDRLSKLCQSDLEATVTAFSKMRIEGQERHTFSTMLSTDSGTV